MNSEGINMVRYSDLTTEQLRSEIEKYKKEAQKAEQVGNISEVAINERKVQMLMSYMAYPEDYKPGEVYEIRLDPGDRKSTRLNSSHVAISYAVFCLKKKK